MSVAPQTGEGKIMSEHIVKSYEQELAFLDDKISQMGGLAEQLVGEAFDSLASHNPMRAKATVASDATIDLLHRELEEQVILMIARRQPMANDLRQIISVLKVAGELERVGDLAKNVAKRAQTISGETHPKGLLTGLQHMTDLASRQLKDVLDAFASRNPERALQVWRQDENLDAVYNSVFRELLTYMMEDPRNITFCTHLLFCAKNIERIGDHATNIAETIQYVVTGKSSVSAHGTRFGQE
jgi:phosphate transport system protein